MQTGRLIHYFTFFILSQALFSAGGVKLLSNSRRISIDNTLDERLRLLEDSVSLARIHGLFSSDVHL